MMAASVCLKAPSFGTSPEVAHSIIGNETEYKE